MHIAQKESSPYVSHLKTDITIKVFIAVAALACVVIGLLGASHATFLRGSLSLSASVVLIVTGSMTLAVGHFLILKKENVLQKVKPEKSEKASNASSVQARPLPKKDAEWIRADLKRWCEEVADKPEYGSRRELADKIWNAYVNKLDELTLSPKLRMETALSSLPKAIGCLSSLKRLVIKGQNIAELPQEIGNLSQLTELDLDYNKLTVLPKELGNLKELTDLSIHNNALVALPEEIFTLHKLKSLDIGNNALKGVLPPGISALTQLKDLALANVGCRSLPPEICSLSSLMYLNCGANQLIFLPKEIGNLKQLKAIKLFSNRLIEIPVELASLKNLEVVDCEGNPLTKEAIEQFQEALKKNHSSAAFKRFNAYVPESINTFRPAHLENPSPHFIPSFKAMLQQLDESAATLEGRYPSEAEFYHPLATHADAKALSILCHQLMLNSEYRDTQTRNRVLIQVGRILKEAVDDPAFREKLFELVRGTNFACYENFHGDAVFFFACIEATSQICRLAQPLSDQELLEIERMDLVRQYSYDLAAALGLTEAEDGSKVLSIALFYLREDLTLPSSLKHVLLPPTTWSSLSKGLDARVKEKLPAMKERILKETQHAPQK